MALNTSGVLSIGGTTAGESINLELGKAQNATSGLGDTDLRDLAGVASGAIKMDDFYGASAGPTAFTSGITSYSTRLTACKNLSSITTYYHNGIGLLPAVNDFVYTNAAGTVTIGAGNRKAFIEIGSIAYTTNSSGKVTAIRSCD
jgi:hypothetical protein